MYRKLFRDCAEHNEQATPMVCVQKFTLILWLTRGLLLLLYLFTELHLFIILPLISDSVSITPNAVLQRTGVKASRGRVKRFVTGCGPGAGGDSVLGDLDFPFCAVLTMLLN